MRRANVFLLADAGINVSESAIGGPQIDADNETCKRHVFLLPVKNASKVRKCPAVLLIIAADADTLVSMPATFRMLTLASCAFHLLVRAAPTR